jgi:DNA repair protein RadC
MSKSHPHHGHRDRLRARFLSEGLDGFEDHQVLELLLFQAFTRQDTNPIAHALLRYFGSFSAVLEADAKELEHVEGIGKNAAVFITMIAPLTRRYFYDRVQRQNLQIKDANTAAQYLVPLMTGRTEEVFYALCLDSKNRVLHPALISQGTVKETVVYPRKVAEAAFRHQASALLISHNHPSGDPTPSAADKALTCQLKTVMEGLSIPILDHIIIAGEKHYSFAESGIF